MLTYRKRCLSLKGAGEDIMAKKKIDKPVKAYKNDEFLTSPSARTIRILSEFIEPQSRFRKYNIRDTIVFFGSSRARPEKEVKADLRKLKANMRESGKTASRFRQRLEKLKTEQKLARYYTDATNLAKRLTEWTKKLHQNHRFALVSGGGPGIMEAANLGATVAKGISIGFNISLPYEQKPNPYISSGYNFEFHYFFMRKLWFAYLAKALVFFPGGFGTMDELFELMTLRQTKKITKPMPIILYGTEYWDQIVDFDALVRWGTISKRDLKLFKRANTVNEAYNYLVSELRGK